MILSPLALVAAASLVSSSPSSPGPDEPIFTAHRVKFFKARGKAHSVSVYKVVPSNESYTWRAKDALAEYYGFQEHNRCSIDSVDTFACQGDPANPRSLGKKWLKELTLGMPKMTIHEACIYNATLVDGKRLKFGTSLFFGNGAGNYTQDIGNMSGKELELVAKDTSRIFNMSCSATPNAFVCQGKKENLQRFVRIRAQCTYKAHTEQLVSCGLL